MVENRYVVYKHTSPSGKCYIGITCKKPERRWGKDGNNYKKQNNKHFANAIDKYGWDNFLHEILEENLSSKEAKRKERYYIKQFNSFHNGYNCTLGGDGGGFIGGYHTDKSKEKISKALKGRFVGELNPMYGVHNNHISINGKLPKYICDKISRKAKANKANIERLKRYNDDREKPVNQYDFNGEFINKYKSASEASRLLNIHMPTIWKCCHRTCGSLSAGGFQWRYSDDCEDIEVYKKNEPIKKYGKNNPNSVEVNQYDLTGRFIKTWDSVSDAARYYKIKPSSISGVLNDNNHRNAKNFQWRRYIDNNECKDIKPFVKNNDYSYCSKIICQYDLLGNFVAQYNSGKEASLITGINTSSISTCCSGKQKQAGGYIWKYTE